MMQWRTIAAERIKRLASVSCDSSGDSPTTLPWASCFRRTQALVCLAAAQQHLSQSALDLDLQIGG
jgi:hypothetical protein